MGYLGEAQVEGERCDLVQLLWYRHRSVTPSGSSQSAGAEINCRDQDCVVFMIFLQGSKYQILVVRCTCRVKLFQEQHSKQKLCKIMTLVLVVFYICKKSVFDSLLFRLLNP